MNNCRHCKGSYEATPHQVKNSDFECPPCRREANRQWRERRKAEGRPVRSTKMPREYHRQYEAAYYQQDEKRERRNALMRAYSKSHATRDHHKARWQVQRALKAGRLNRQPCEVCGATKTHAHHDDYAQPLSVRWLCPPHHYEHHSKAEGQS